MIKHTFLDKCCTILENSKYNTGLNPVAELNYGTEISRVLLHFDTDELKKLYDEKEFCDITKLTHTLKLTNCGSINNDIHNKSITSTLCDMKERATSFDVLLFKLPKFWDGGKGVDYTSDFWITEQHNHSIEGCNWYQNVSGGEWEKPGIYSIEYLKTEYEKFLNNEETIIVATQHFDVGNENFEFNITDYVNNLILTEEVNYGLGLCFAPSLESKTTKTQQYVGFFTCHTNTFYHPYVETIYTDVICDNRDDFKIGEKNRLYLYCYDGKEYYNLDELPSCIIEGYEDVTIDVKQQGKGIYYAEFLIKKGEVEPNTILYDKWFNLSVNGEILDDEEFEFVVLPSKRLFNIEFMNEIEYIPSISGIHRGEHLNNDENRKLNVTFRKKYTTNQYKVLTNCYYRLYVIEGNKEIDVFPWHPIEKRFLSNRFYLNTGDLVPNVYYIDIKTNEKTHKEICNFQVVNNITQRYM